MGRIGFAACLCLGSVLGSGAFGSDMGVCVCVCFVVQHVQ